MQSEKEIETEATAVAEVSPLPGPAPTSHGRKTLSGTILVFIAEALILPTGLITASYMTGRLGTDGYGAFTLAATIVGWIEWTITSVFARPTIKFIGETENWPPVARAVVKQYLLVSLLLMIVLMLIAHPLAVLLSAENLTHSLRIFAMDIPLFGLAQAYRNILIGRGKFASRAVGGAVRWLVRLGLIVWFVGMGWWLEGAIWASVVTSVVEVAVNFALLRPPLRAGGSFPMNKLWDYAGPLLFSVLSLRLFEKMDIFGLQWITGSTANTGVYGAAQNISIVPGILAISFTPLVLATVSKQLSQGDETGAREMGRQALRIILLLLPGSVAVAGASSDIIGWIFKPEYAAAAAILTRLVIGAWAMMMISTATAILVAAGKPTWTLWVTVPLLPLAIVGHYLLIPHFGANGAADVTMFVTMVGGIAGVTAVWLLWRIIPGLGSLLRAVAVSVFAYFVGQLFPSHGILLICKMLGIAGCCAGLLVLLGEFTAAELEFVKSFVLRRKESPA